MKKRISARAIIIENEQVLAMFRRKRKDDGTFKEYYVIPGGGLENGESLEETCKRELEEEFSVKINILGYLGYKERENAIGHFFHADIVDGVPTLGGEEGKGNNINNYYEIRRVDLNKIDELDIDAVDLIKKAQIKEYTKYN